MLKDKRIKGLISSTLLITTALFLGNMICTQPAHTELKSVIRPVGGWYKITNDTYRELTNKGLQKNVLEFLKPLIDKKFVTKEEFEKALSGIKLTKEQKNLILKYADVGIGKMDWTYATIKVTGRGFPPLQGTPGQKNLMAKRAAQLDGYRQLVEIVNGVQVSSETIVENFVTKSDTIKTSVKRVVKGAKPVGAARHLEDGTVELDMTMPVYGDKGLASALDFGNFVEKESGKDLNMKPSGKPPFFMKIALLPFRTDIPFADNYQLAAATGYTGLIVNASGLGVEPAMCPFIIGGAKRVYPSNKIELDPDSIVREGVTHYVTDLDEAKQDTQRVGSNPLIIEAKGVKPGCDLILGEDSITKVTDENQKSKFLNNLNVSIVID